eukprot:3264065-Prymnesium_polylepis.1
MMLARRSLSHAKLWSALVRRSRQACGRTAPTSERRRGLHRVAKVRDQFHSDTDFDPVLA